MKKEYYELLGKSELAGVIVALQKLTTQQADRINDLERIERKLREQIEECVCEGGHSQAYLKAKGRL
jgi:hypothetical protein